MSNEEGNVEASLARVFYSACVTERVPACVAAVSQGKDFKWSRSTGIDIEQADPLNVQFRIGSISKTLVSLALLRQQALGSLCLSDSIGTYVEELPSPLRMSSLLTVLNHSAGIAAEPPIVWWERTAGPGWQALADEISETDSIGALAGRFHYSNLGYAILGRVLEVASGRSWFDAVRREVLEPLDMARTTERAEEPYVVGYSLHPWEDATIAEPAPEYAAMAPAGGLWSTAADLLKLALAFTDYGDGSFLSIADVRKLIGCSVVQEPGKLNRAYGLGVELEQSSGSLLVGNFGSVPGFRAAFWTTASNRSVAVVLANSTAGLVPAALASKLLALVPMSGEINESSAVRADPHSPASSDLVDEMVEAGRTVAGLWYWGARPIIVQSFDSDRILRFEEIGGGAVCRFARLGPRSWVGLDHEHEGEGLTLVATSDDGDDYIDLHSWILTRKPYDASMPIPGGPPTSGWRRCDTSIGRLRSENVDSDQ